MPHPNFGRHVGVPHKWPYPRWSHLGSHPRRFWGDACGKPGRPFPTWPRPSQNRMELRAGGRHLPKKKGGGANPINAPLKP